MEEASSEDLQIVIELRSTSLTVAPGGGVTVAVFLHSQSPTDGTFELTVGGIPN